MRMLRTERFAHRQYALKQRARCCKVALALEQEGEGVETYRRIGMLRAERPFPYSTCALKERRGLGVICAPEEIRACPVQKLRDRTVFRDTLRKQMWRELRALPRSKILR